MLQRRIAASAFVSKCRNMAIKHENFQIPTYEDVVGGFGGKQYFTVLVQKDSFWQVALINDSLQLCIFNMPFRHYRFLRIPVGMPCN